MLDTERGVQIEKRQLIALLAEGAVLRDVVVAVTAHGRGVTPLRVVALRSLRESADRIVGTV